MLANLTDLVAIGAIPDNTVITEKYGIRATRLLELASAQVCAYLRTTEPALVASITTEQSTSLAAIVAECAGNRLNVSAAPSTNPYANMGVPASVMLNRWHKRQIDELIGTGSSISTVVDRDQASSALSYMTLGSEFLFDDFDVVP